MGIPSSPLYKLNSKAPVPDSPKLLVIPYSPRSHVLNSPKFPGMDVQPPKTCLQDVEFGWMTAQLSEIPSVMLSGDICTNPVDCDLMMMTL